MTHHPLVARLVEQFSCPALTDETLETFLAASGDSIVFCGGDPAQYPECLDVAVVLPELQAAFSGRFRVGVATREIEAGLQATYGFQRWPALVLLRDGQYVGAIAGMQDWTVYLARIGELLATPASRPPSVGIPVTSASTSHCH